MKAFRIARWHVWLTILIGVLILLARAYYQIIFTDPYGECRKKENFDLCLDAWIEPGSLPFKALASDQELISRFNQNRNQFEQMREWALNRPGADIEFPPAEWEGRLHILWIKRDKDWKGGSGCVDDAGMPIKACQHLDIRWRLVKFQVDRTRYIDREYWPFSNRVKYYAYVTPTPNIEAGWVSEQGGARRWILSQDLDMGWPENFGAQECLMRKIDAQWFLMLCKNDIGG